MPSKRHARPDLVRAESRYTWWGDCRLHARVLPGPSPGAPDVVLVHGLAVSSRYMMRLAHELASDFRVFAPDLPGVGLSDSSDRATDVPGLARALAGWLDANGIARAAFFGNSLGCQTVAELARVRPDLVSHAVLQGATTDPSARRTITQVLRWARCGLLEPVSLFPILVRDYFDAAFRGTRVHVGAMLDHPMDEVLAQLTVPVLFVRGEHDPIAPRAWAERAAWLARGRLVVLRGAAHAANFSHARKLARIVRAFVREPAVA